MKLDDDLLSYFNVSMIQVYNDWDLPVPNGGQILSYHPLKMC